MLTGLFKLIDELIDFSDHASWQNPPCVVHKIVANKSIAIDIAPISRVNGSS